jgi:CDP-glucose 4,6-dehydratase
MVIETGFWSNKRVLVTGHTGFKGGWLSLWLHALGSEVHGYALNPPTEPSLFEVANLRELVASDTRADLAELATLHATFQASRPEIVFHLAAQPLVRESYRDPLYSFSTNVMGTAHVLEAARKCESVRAVVIVTTDKVYENLENAHRYSESDPLGGYDPYSASKAAAEIVTASYRRSYFSRPTDHPAQIATARAGNVIGGGDWAAERLVPDCLRAFQRGEPVRLRRPQAVRPWQHVLEPLSGYLQLAERLYSGESDDYAAAWNFGPDAGDDASVGDVADAVARLWGDAARVVRSPSERDPHEAGLLRLDSEKARRKLGWRPRWSLQDALIHTVNWHRAWMKGSDMLAVSRAQTREYAQQAGA